MRYLVAAALALCLSGVSAPAWAQLMLGGADAAIVADLAVQHGSAELRHDVINWPTIVATNAQGHAYEIDFQGCGDGDDCQSLWFLARFANSPLTLEQVNAFNRDYLFARAYLTSDGQAILQMDISLSPPVSGDWLDGQFRIWSQLLNLFADIAGG